MGNSFFFLTTKQMLKSLTLLLLAQLSSSLEAETSIGDFTEITVTVDSEPQ